MALWKRKPDEVVKMLVDMETIEGLLKQIDSATNRLDESIEKAAITIRQLERARHSAEVATREANVAADAARQAIRRAPGHKKW